MSIIAQYRQGFAYGIDSIHIVRNNLMLLVYRTIPALYQTIASLINPTLQISALWLSSSLVFQDIHGSPFSSFCLFMRTTTLHSFLFHALFALVGTLLVVACNGALCHHVLHAMHYRTTSVRNALASVTSRATVLMLWACISLAVESILALIGVVIGTYIPYVPLLFGVVWIYSSILMIPIIMSDRKSLRDCIRLAYKLTQRVWPEILGGFSLFALLTLTLWWVIHVAATLIWLPLHLYGFLLITLVIGTLRIVFATVLYMRTYQEPNEELEALMHVDII